MEETKRKQERKNDKKVQKTEQRKEAERRKERRTTYLDLFLISSFPPSNNSKSKGAFLGTFDGLKSNISESDLLLFKDFGFWLVEEVTIRGEVEVNVFVSKIEISSESESISSIFWSSVFLIWGLLGWLGGFNFIFWNFEKKLNPDGLTSAKFPAVDGCCFTSAKKDEGAEVFPSGFLNDS